MAYIIEITTWEPEEATDPISFEGHLQLNTAQEKLVGELSSISCLSVTLSEIVGAGIYETLYCAHRNMGIWGLTPWVVSQNTVGQIL